MNKANTKYTAPSEGRDADGKDGVGAVGGSMLLLESICFLASPSKGMDVNRISASLKFERADASVARKNPPALSYRATGRGQNGAEV